MSWSLFGIIHPKEVIARYHKVQPNKWGGGTPLSPPQTLRTGHPVVARPAFNGDCPASGAGQTRKKNTGPVMMLIKRSRRLLRPKGLVMTLILAVIARNEVTKQSP